MATTSMTVRYRLVRVGFHVQDGRINDLVKAADVNTLLWGGLYNPFVLVSPSRLDFAEKLVNLFSVDVLYAVSAYNAANRPMTREIVDG